MIKSRWYVDTWSGWVIVGRRVGLKFDIGHWFIGLNVSRYEIMLGLGPLRIVVHLDTVSKWGG